MSKDWIDFMEDTKQQASKDSMYKTWPNVCLWIEALRNPNANYVDCIDEYGNFATKKLQRNLLEVAIVNINKLQAAEAAIIMKYLMQQQGAVKKASNIKREFETRKGNKSSFVV